MLILLGKGGAGKDSVAKELVNRYGYKYLVPYTTRPPRLNEVKGQDYHYISRHDFRKKVKSGFFVEWQTYETQFGKWYYGIAADDFYDADDKTVAIFAPSTIRKLSESLYYDDTVIYLLVSERVIRERLLSRGDDYDEVRRRMRSDNVDFIGISNYADYIVAAYDKTVNQIAQEIVRLVED